MSSSLTPIGFVYGWRGGYVYVLVNDENYEPGVGDLLYAVDSRGKYSVLQVVGFEGEIPVPPSSIIHGVTEAPALYDVSKSVFAKASLFLEIRDYSGKPLVIKSNEPPPLDSKVYLLNKSSLESSIVMRKLSEGIIHPDSSETVPIAWLRAGVAPVEYLRNQRYFAEAPLRVDLFKLITKHVLIAGQTGSGKTTGLMGITISWCLDGKERRSWLIIDKHGEYHRREYVDLIVKALKQNKYLSNVKAFIYILDISSIKQERRDNVEINVTPIKLSSLDIMDLANVTNLSQDRVSELEELVTTIFSLIETAMDKGREHADTVKLLKVFFEKDSVSINGNVLGLIPLLIDNMVRYEGVGERDKRGLYRILLSQGLDIRKLRSFRRLVLSTLGLSVRKARLETSNGDVIYVSVLDDSKTVFKVPMVLKDPESLVKTLRVIVDANNEIKKGARKPENKIKYSDYPWLFAKIPDHVKVDYEINYLEIDELIEKLEKGSMLILDLSKIPIYQGDMIVMSLLRRVFENRISIGVEKSRELPLIAVVSEEAPLYLSPDKVDNPYNVFARIAREGRKFGLGLIAVTQIATIIEKQILANFNTYIALRTKHPGDLNFYSEIGLPPETMPFLNDREGFIYTPDLNVKEPLPVYIPAYMDLKQLVEERYRSKIDEEKRDAGVIEKLTKM